MQPDTLQQLFESALQAGRERDYPLAIQFLQELLCKTDQMPEALLYLGRAYHAIGQYDHAAQVLQFFLNIESESAQGHFFLGRTYTALAKYRPSLRHLKRSLELQADFVPALGLYALNLLKIGKPKAALKLFKRALEIDPDQPKIFTGYLNALLIYAIRRYTLEQFEDAGELFRFIAEHRPDSMVVNLYLASIYRELGQFSLSLAHYTKASQLAPEDPILGLQKAVVYFQQGDSSKAIAELSAAMKRLGGKVEGLSDPHSLFRFMTLLLYQNKRYRQALDCGRRVLKQDYQDSDTHAIMAECLRETGELTKAKNHYQRALSRNQDKLELYYGLINVLWEAKEYDELFSVLNKVLRQAPDDEIACYYLAVTLPFTGKSFEKTIPIIQDQIRRVGPDPHLMGALGTEYLRARLPDLAEGWFKKTLQQVCDDTIALGSLITVYTMLDKKAELHKSFANYLKYFHDDRTVRKAFARSLFKEHKYVQAAREIEKILPLEHSKSPFKKMLAVSYRKQKKYSDAIIILREILRENPLSEESLRSLVFCLEQTGNSPTAIQLLENASHVMKDRPSILLPLGVLYAKANQLEAASIVFRQVIDLNPKNWKAHHNLGMVYSQMGNEEFAEKFLNRAQNLKI